MKPLEIIKIICNAFLGLKVNVIWTVMRKQGKRLVNGFVPQDFAGAVALDDILCVAVNRFRNNPVSGTEEQQEG